MSCPKCDGPSQDGLCQECSFDRDHAFYQRRAEEMADGEEGDG